MSYLVLVRKVPICRHCHFRSEALGIPVTAKSTVTDSIVSLVLSGILFGRNPAVLAVLGHGFTPLARFARQKHAGYSAPKV